MSPGSRKVLKISWRRDYACLGGIKIRRAICSKKEWRRGDTWRTAYVQKVVMVLRSEGASAVESTNSALWEKPGEQ